MTRSKATKAAAEANPLNGYNPDYLACRTDRHQWGKAFWVPVGTHVSERIRQCAVCATRVVWIVDTKRWTRVQAAHYRYAPGFLRPRSGLVKADYTAAHLANDFAAARNEGRIGK